MGLTVSHQKRQFFIVNRQKCTLDTRGFFLPATRNFVGLTG